MSAWFSPEILLTLTGVGLILIDSLASEGIRRRIPLLALLASIAPLLRFHSGRGMESPMPTCVSRVLLVCL